MLGETTAICSACGARNSGLSTLCQQCGRALASPGDLRSGSLLASRYEIQALLGGGGMGMVYKARDRLLNETVAIKVLRPEAAQAPESAARFISEIKLARAVSHKNVARIHEYGEDRGVRYISMAFVDGGDLKRELRERGPLPLAEAFEVAAQAAEGLHAIHEEGIVHRDLKSSNIMRDRSGVVRLMDFGIAKLGSASLAADMTTTGQIIGTPEYMSPEQIRGLRLDRRSDIYSLGVVTYELFTGRTPFRGESAIATLLMHLNDTPALEAGPAGLIPGSVGPVLRKALAKDPEDRFKTALEFALALKQARDACSEDEPAGAFRPPEGARAADAIQEAARASGSLQPTASLATTPRAWPTASSRRPVLGRAAGPASLGLFWALGVTALGAAGLTFLSSHDGPGSSPPRAVPPPAPVKNLASGAAPARAVTLTSTPPASVPAAPARARADTPARIRAEPGGAQERPAEAVGRLAARTDNEDKGSGTVVSDAATEARKQVAARIEALLADAGTALENQSYDAAIALYDQILELDPHQQMARIARATALNAKLAAHADTAPRPERGRAFIAGKTAASVADAGPDRALSEAFEEGAGIDVQRDTHPSRPPGQIEFEARPEAPQAGAKYALKVYFTNPAKAPISLREMIVTNIVNGHKAAGPVTPVTRTVAPGERALLLSLEDFLPEGTDEWSLDVVAKTTGGETYENRLVWK